MTIINKTAKSSQMTLLENFKYLGRIKNKIKIKTNLMYLLFEAIDLVSVMVVVLKFKIAWS